MLSKDNVRDSLIHEYQVIKQLVSKLPDGCEDYRISPTQRSTIELLRYLLLVGPAVMHAANDNGFAWLEQNAPHCSNVSLADVPSHLDGAMAEMNHVFAGWSDDDFAKRQVSIASMGDWTVGTWLLNTACKFVPAYKLQLFHHAKACGNTGLATWDAWMDNGKVTRPSP